ncbi:NAD-dependent epimerase/dehydratase family protein [Rhizobium sp. IMFF44]|uniref:NAD-dependent epimerase/dehydratase family protein n=1 Tax=Rhizobium sp. IMFF44 TaxID=3342350 RepID=UPI0035BACC5E
MKIMVTGSTGKVGRATIDRLIEEDHQVFAVDAVAPANPKCKFSKIDGTDFGQVLESVLGIDSAHLGQDAIVHVSAIPGATK